MAHHASVVPAPGTYHRVLRRYDRDPRFAHQQTFVSYDVSLRAVNAELDGKPAMTLFFPAGKDVSADRALRTGWIDCTAAWHASLGAVVEPDMGPLTAVIDDMSWVNLKSYAKSEGLKAVGTRDELTAKVVEHEQKKLVAAALAYN